MIRPGYYILSYLEVYYIQVFCRQIRFDWRFKHNYFWHDKQKVKYKGDISCKRIFIWYLFQRILTPVFTCNIFSLNKQNQSRVKGTKQKQIIDTRFLSISNAVLPCDYIPTYPCKIRHTRCSVALSGPNSRIFLSILYLPSYLCPKSYLCCLKSLHYYLFVYLIYPRQILPLARNWGRYAFFVERQRIDSLIDFRYGWVALKDKHSECKQRVIVMP